MRCPQCRTEQFSLDSACSICNFEASIELLEQLSNVNYVIQESFDWTQFDQEKLDALREEYGRKLRQIEVQIGVRQPPPNLEEARELVVQKAVYERYLHDLSVWESKKWISAVDASDVRQETVVAIDAINERLTDAPTVYQTSVAERKTRLAMVRYFLDRAQALAKAGKLHKQGYRTLTKHYNTQIEKLEIELGIRDAADKTPKTSRLSQIRQRIPTLNRSARGEQKPREPWTWDRVWETLLSERTLEVILFIGVALLFAAGVTWVGFNWGTFAAPVQIAFLVGFTGLFFGLGGYVTRSLKLRGSGVALFGVGSLLIPLDFYAFYLSGGFPDGSEPLIWMIGSIVCLIIYLLVAYGLRAPFFGYLIGFAVASNGLAALNLADVPLVWWQTAVSITGFGLGMIGFVGLQNKDNRSAFLAEPFQRIGLIFVSVIMILGLSWRFFFGTPFLNTVPPLTISWWLGGVILALGARRLRLTGLVWATAVSFPVAMWFTQQTLFPSSIDTGWYGVGLAILVPLYFLIAKRLHSEGTGEGANYDRIVLIVAGGITAVSAVWSLTNTSAASLVHPLLALTLIFATLLWQQPRWLWLSGLLLMSGGAAWQGARGATLPELSLPWGLLSILFVVVAIQLRSQKVRYDMPLFGMGWIAALAAIVPPALLNDRLLLVYALANWIGVNCWLAVLAAPQTHPGLQKFLNETPAKRLGEALFHWSASLALLPWLGLFLDPADGEAIPWLVAAYAGLAWLMLGLGVWARRLYWKNGRAWFVSANLAVVLVIYLELIGYGFEMPNSEIWYGSALLAVAALYLLLALFSTRKIYFYLAGWIGVVGWSILLEAITRTPDNRFIIWERPEFLAFLPVILLIMALFTWLASRRWRTAAFYQPLYTTVVIQTVLFVLISFNFLEAAQRSQLMWGALAYALIGLSFACFAWVYWHQITAHLSIWMLIGAGGLLVLQFSRGSGRSAFLAGLLALGLILAERGLRPLTLRPISHITQLLRKIWRLYRRPLQLAGWMISLGTIGLATFRNLVLLGGGETRQIWSILALTAVVVLYALSGWLYGKKRFAYFAALLAVLPWSLLIDLQWSDTMTLTAFGLSWTIFALILIGVAIILLSRLPDRGWGLAVQLIGIGIMIAGLFLSVADEGVNGMWAFLAGILFFATAVYLDRRFYKPEGWEYGRFLYPLLLIIPIWAVLLFDLVVVNETYTQIGLLILLFSAPALWVGRLMVTREPSYQLPFYLLAYGSAAASLPFVGETQPVLIGALFYIVILTAVSVWIFDEPLWWFPSTFTLPVAVALLMDQLDLVETHYLGWMLIGLGGLYLFGAWLLTTQNRQRYSWPLLTMSAVFGLFGLPFLLDSIIGVAVGFLGAAILFAVMAIWRKLPILMFWVGFLLMIAYGAFLIEIEPSDEWLSLSGWPLVLFFLAMGLLFDRILGRLTPNDMKSIGWGNPDSFIYQLQSVLLLWWGFAFYTAAFGLVPIASMFGFIDFEWRMLVGMGVGTAVYAFGLFRFREKLFLLLTGAWLQFAWATLIEWRNWSGGLETEFTYYFLPATVLVTIVGILIERGVFRRMLPWLTGRRWAIPLYILFVVNFFIGQNLAFVSSWQGIWITTVHGVLVALLVTVWAAEWLAVLPLLLWFIAFGQFGDWQDWSPEAMIPRLAVLALLYGTIGYGWRWRSQLADLQMHWLRVWQRPLIWGGWILSSILLLIGLGRGINVVALGLRALFGNVVLLPTEITQTQMVVATFAVVGLFYLIGSLSERQPRWSYGALLLLIISWSLWLRLIGQQAELQFYAIPVSIYLLGIGWYEWETGVQPLGRWIDRLALLLLFGSAFWQSLMAEVGGAYALLMIIEGLLIVWFGSARRLRRLLYAGVTAVMVALMGQLIRPLLALNTGVLLLLGAILVGLGILLERRLENVRTLSQEFRQRLESWE